MRATLFAALVALISCESSSRPQAPPAVTPTPPLDKKVTVEPTPTPTPVTPPAPDALAKLARSSNAFGFDLYAQLRATPGNLIVSPASITTALAMTWGGARGETAAQMKKVLHLDGAPADVMAVSGALARSLEDPSRPIIFRIANRLFGEKSFTFEKPYLDQTAAAFGAPLEMLDFQGGFEAARARINAWAESKTEQRIKELVPRNGVDKDTRLVLVNAVYFLGDWAEPFSHERTRPQPFLTAKATSKDVPTMNRTGEFAYAKRDGLAALEIPYKGGSMSMLFVVPNAVDGLAALEKSLDATKLDALVAALKSERVWAQIPTFEVAPPASLSLGDTLKAMGMTTAFDRQRADFTGIANPPTPQDRLVIGEVFHKAFVKVNEKGTEAAAATAVSMPRAGAAPSQPLEFKADRPFLYFIRDTASGLILFMGRVSDPTAK